MQTPVINPQQAGLAAASADMNAYAAACNFLLSPPMIVAAANRSAQSLTGGSTAAIVWAAPIKNNDLAWTAGSPDRFTVNTQGFYEVAAGVIVGSAAITAECFLQVTTGPQNPNGSGIGTSYWHADETAFTGAATALRTAGIIPAILYPGDILQFIVQPTNNCTTAQLAATGYWGDYTHRLVSL